MAELPPLLILASGSASRAAMLAAAGVNCEVWPADVDERAVERTILDAEAVDVAFALATAKAVAVSHQLPGRLVLGGDSLAECAGQRFAKPASRDDAARHLRHFSGRVIVLTSAAVLARDGAVVWSHAEAAHLAVRRLSENFIDAYLDAEWPAVAGCVGVFRFEGRGVQLFEQVNGDYFTILGMPLLPVLAALRGHGVLAA